MAGRHAATQRAAWKPLAVAAAGAAVLLTTGFGAWAGLSATATHASPQTAGSGTLSLTMANAGAGFSQPISELAPGDTVHRFVNLTQAGTLAAQNLTLSVTSTAGNALTGTGATALRYGIASCSTAWAANATCSAGAQQLVPLTTTLASAIATPAVLVPGALAPGTTTRLRVTLLLPDTDEVTTNGVAPAGSAQGLSTNLTWTFQQQQRTATTTSS